MLYTVIHSTALRCSSFEWPSARPRTRVWHTAVVTPILLNTSSSTAHYTPNYTTPCTSHTVHCTPHYTAHCTLHAAYCGVVAFKPLRQLLSILKSVYQVVVSPSDRPTMEAPLLNTAMEVCIQHLLRGIKPVRGSWGFHCFNSS